MAPTPAVSWRKRRRSSRAISLPEGAADEADLGLDHVVAEAAIEHEGLLVLGGPAIHVRQRAADRVDLEALDDVAEAVLGLAEHHRLRAVHRVAPAVGLHDLGDVREDLTR